MWWKIYIVEHFLWIGLVSVNCAVYFWSIFATFNSRISCLTRRANEINILLLSWRKLTYFGRIFNQKVRRTPIFSVSFEINRSWQRSPLQARPPPPLNRILGLTTHTQTNIGSGGGEWQHYSRSLRVLPCRIPQTRKKCQNPQILRILALFSDILNSTCKGDGSIDLRVDRSTKLF
jgi:hypothetical protein